MRTKEVNRNDLIVRLRDEKKMKWRVIGEWLNISKQRANIIYHKQKALSAPPVNVNSI